MEAYYSVIEVISNGLVAGFLLPLVQLIEQLIALLGNRSEIA